MFIRALAGCVAAMWLLACGSDTSSTSNSTTQISPSNISGVLTETPAGGGVSYAASTGDVSLIMQDACDPDSFNAAIGAGACVRNGGIKFDAFIEQLTKLGFVGRGISPRRA